jgi:hypothetical protein
VPSTTFEHSTGTFAASSHSEPPRRRGLLIGVAVVVVALGVGAYLFSDQLAGRVAGRSQGDVTEEDPGNARQSAGPAHVDPGPAPTATITIEVDGAPEGVEVTVDGEPNGLPLRLARDNAAHRLVFKAPGYEPETRIIEASTSQVIALSLKAIKQPDPQQAAPGARHAVRPARPYYRTPAPPPQQPARPNPPPKRGSDLIIDI